MLARTFTLFLLLSLWPLAQLHAQCNDTEVTITAITGNYGYEMSWELHDDMGTLIQEWEGINNYDTSILTICVPNGCYTLTALDSYGDGWNGGKVEMTWDNESIEFLMPDGSIDYTFFGINATDCIPIIPGCTDANAYNYDPAATIDDGSCLDLDGLLALQVWDTICHSGSKDNRINFVIQNRGTGNPNNAFTSADDLRAALDDNFVPAFMWGDPQAKMPYAQYKDFFNLYAVYWPDAPSDQTWWSFNAIKDMRDSTFLPWANNETGWATWFSTTRFGGGGGAGLIRLLRVGDGKMFGTDYETLLHEFGHTMPGLLDEYTSSGVWSNNQCFETGNTTEYTIKDSIPWRNWIDDDIPLPTPYNGDYDGPVGAFEGGLTNYFGCHRPTAKGCYMGAGGFGPGYGDDLCSPCVQRVICFLYRYVNVIENPLPANPNVNVTGAQTLNFSANVIKPEPNTQTYQWFLNGRLIAENTTAVDVLFGSCDQYELKFVVTDTTPLVRYDEKFEDIYPKPEREHIWTINQTDISSYDLEATLMPINANCTGEQNGMVIFTPSGGLAPYQFWGQGQNVGNPAADLAPGDYTFDIVDANGCRVNHTIQIGQDPFLDLEICAIQNSTWEVSVASQNYDVNQLDLLWSTGATGPVITGLNDGSYSLTATANGCAVNEDINLETAPANMTVTDEYYPSELNNSTGSIYVTVEGGTPDYAIRWYERLMADQTDDNVDNIEASGTTWGHLPEMAFDNNFSTKWLHAVPNNAWVGYTFPSPTTIPYYAITSADDVPERDPLDWQLEASNDGMSWTILDQRFGEDFPNRFQRRAFPIANPGAYTHYRLYVLSSAGENQIQLQELEFIGTNPDAPFSYNPEFDDQFNRTELPPGEYRYEVSDASSACDEATIPVNVFEAFYAINLKVVPDGSCGVTIENPLAAYDYYWLSDEIGTTVLGTGLNFQPPYPGNFYLVGSPIGSGQWSTNRKGFAVTMPEAPEIISLGDTALAIANPLPGESYQWYTLDDCVNPVHVGETYEPGVTSATYYISAQSTQVYPDPIDPSTLSGLILQMDASDLDGDGAIDDPAPATSSILDWYFPTGGNWAPDNWFAYRSNYQNGLGISDWATLWLQRIEDPVSNFQTVLMAYEENALSWENTGPMEALSEEMPRHADASQLFSNDAPPSTLNGTTYLNGQVVDPLSTENPMAFCVLGSVFTEASNANIFYTDTHWEGKVGEMLFFDQALTDEQMKGVSEHLRKKWISTAELESPRTRYEWGMVVSNQEIKQQQLKVYPNPSTGLLYLATDWNGPLGIRVLDMHGRVIHSQSLFAARQPIHINSLPSGLYLLEVNMGGAIEVVRFVKE